MDAVSRKTKSIIDLRNNGRWEELLTWVKVKLIETLEYLGAFELAAREFQIIRLAERICNKCYDYKPSELEFFFTAFEDGQYGKLYSGKTMNPQDIMQALALYDIDLREARGRNEDKMKEEQRKRESEEAKLRPHGMEAWKLYCESKGRSTEFPTLSIAKDMNKELCSKTSDTSDIVTFKQNI